MDVTLFTAVLIQASDCTSSVRLRNFPVPTELTARKQIRKACQNEMNEEEFCSRKSFARTQFNEGAVVFVPEWSVLRREQG